MISMPQIQSIRSRRRNGESIASIARSERVSEPTVRKYLRVDDLSARPPVRRRRGSVIDEWLPVIEGMLAEDRETWRKQRHTATRIHERLRDEYGAGVSLSTVTRTVARLKREFMAEREMGFLDLSWHPGECQADFGQVDVRYRGVVTRMRHFVLDFPYSNIGPSQLMPGENAECTCQALRNLFEWLGGVPERIVYDNAAGVGRKWFDGIRLTRLFQAFQAHYGFEYTFCNPYSGHEKGAVEARVGAVRRRLFVPVPGVWNLDSFNLRLPGRCLELGDKDHYRKGESQTGLFDEDRKALLPLPAKPFDVVTWTRMKADKYGNITVQGSHRYAAGPEHAGHEMIVGLRALEVEILDAEGKRVITHPRSYGDKPTDSGDPSSQLGLLCDRPAAWRNSRVRDAMPDPLREWIDAQDEATRRDSLRALLHADGESGWRAAVAGMPGDPRIHRRHGPGRGMSGRGTPRLGPGTRGLRRPRGPERIRHRLHQGGRVNQKNGRTDPGPLRERARSLFISKATIDETLEWATPRQLDAIDRMLATELANREASKRARLMRQARFPVPKSLDGYDFANVRLPDGYTKEQLTGLDFAAKAQDLVFYGKTGRGKTHLATALGMLAIEQGRSVRFRQTAELVLQLGKAKRDGALDSLLRDLARADLIILDEFGYAPVRLDGARLLYQIIAGSYERRSIILRHEHRVQQMGDDLRRRQTRRRDHRPHRPPRTPHRIHRPQPTRQPSPHVRQDGQPVRQTTGRHSSCRKPKKISDETRNTDLTKNTTMRYVHRWREANRGVPDREGYVRLEWAAGSMQVDFGVARARIAGEMADVHCLVVSLPYSNMRLCVALPGENAECLCHGLMLVFEHIGGVPPVIVMDNATGAGRRNAKGEVALTGGVLRVRGALPARGPVLQPVLGQREGQRGERGRVFAAQSHGAAHARGIVWAVEPSPAGAVRRARQGLVLPEVAGRARGRGVRRGEGRVDAVAVHGVRPGSLGKPDGRQVRAGRHRLEPVPRRPRFGAFQGIGRDPVGHGHARIARHRRAPRGVSQTVRTVAQCGGSRARASPARGQTPRVAGKLDPPGRARRYTRVA